MSEQYAKLYQEGLKKAWSLDDKYSEKTQILFKAYLAAAQELGFKDKDLLDAEKGAQLARLMFSDKYLGNADFNPLLKSDSTLKALFGTDELDAQRIYLAAFGVNAETLGGANGYAQQHGLQQQTALSIFTDASERNKRKDLESFLWNIVFDPEAPWGDNLESYTKLLSNDPILSHYGRSVSPKKFFSLDDAAKTAVKSLQGKSTLDEFVHKWGVSLN